jgi:DNA-binding MurR/RpiR family transcriptional regulator
VVRLTLEKTPKGTTHWSSRMLAARTGLGQSTISRIWRPFGLKPHRTERKNFYEKSMTQEISAVERGDSDKRRG